MARRWRGMGKGMVVGIHGTYRRYTPPPPSRYAACMPRLPRLMIDVIAGMPLMPPLPLPPACAACAAEARRRRARYGGA